MSGNEYYIGGRSLVAYEKAKAKEAVAAQVKHEKFEIEQSIDKEDDSDQLELF